MLGDEAAKDSMSTGKVKVSNPITGLDRPWGFQEAEAPRI
jgi:hypothetical protein